ncbi:MAG TPA: hypothetical protein VK760_04560 [Candidatus Acidoferrales bacterium]|nr:hypothetical protein [Candidatus Acidoferrales bacterium]
MTRFVSVGANCEFGFAQRAHGAESFDLFRWARISVPILLHVLSERLSEIGDPEQIELRATEFGEWTGFHRKYGFEWHTFVLPERRMSLEALHRRECARISKLASLFVDHLMLGDKIFVFAGSELTESDVRPLVDAIRLYGAAPLLFVTSATSRSRTGTVEVVEDGLLHGYLDRFSDPYDMPATTDANAWLGVCEAALIALRDANEPAPELAAIQSSSDDGALAATDGDSSWEVEALATAWQALALCPADAENHAHIGWLLEQKGDFDAAARELRNALELRPGESRYGSALEGIELRKRRRELTELLDEVIFNTAQIALRDNARAKRVLADLFPALYYFTPWVELRRRFANVASPEPAEDLLKEAMLPLLELCVVDEEFYASQHPDLQDAHEAGSLESLSEHWRTHGYFEGRICRSDELT